MAGADRAVVDANQQPVAFTIGSRPVVSFRRSLVTLAFTLEQARAAEMPALPDIGTAHGLRVLSAPMGEMDRIRAHYPGFRIGAQQSYARAFIDMAAGGFDDYLAGFSGKTRSTLRRKRRKLEEAGSGALDVRSYRTPEEMSEFLVHAQALSRRTYQARLLDAGLPEGEIARAETMELARQDRVRAFLLFLHGEPIAYLYLPVDGSTLVYAHLGYHPAYAALSPGTVLQMAALEELFAENRFRYFDFTEGQGAHKALFGTDSVECTSFLLLQPSLGNRALLAGLDIFDRATAGARGVASRIGLEAALRKWLRA